MTLAIRTQPHSAAYTSRVTPSKNTAAAGALLRVATATAVVAFRSAPRGRRDLRGARVTPGRQNVRMSGSKSESMSKHNIALNTQSHRVHMLQKEKKEKHDRLLLFYEVHSDPEMSGM